MEKGLAKAVTVYSAEVSGLDVPIIEVEVHASAGLPHVDIVGLAEPCVREAKQRVRAAIVASGYRFPDDKITVNLAPAAFKKNGSGFDLAIAVGILVASGKVALSPDADGGQLRRHLLVGELSLSGDLRPAQGIVGIAMAARERGIKKIILPVVNAREAALVSGLTFYPAPDLAAVLKHLDGRAPLSPLMTIENERSEGEGRLEVDTVEMAAIRGHPVAKKALVVAAAGGHNLLFVGPPGSGKTLLARTFPALLPDLNEVEAIETTCLYSCAGLLAENSGLRRRPPFRAPHHSLSDGGLIGGGKNLGPGEISLAHNGVLFLDELPEFRRNVLETLREPLESGHIQLSRANGTVNYPARIQLLAAMNPCPCGYADTRDRFCQCSPRTIQNYTKRLSGPLFDRFDLRLRILPLRYEEFFAPAKPALTTATAREQVEAARHIQKARFASSSIRRNAEIPADRLEEFCPLDEKARALLLEEATDLRLTGRGLHRLIRVARTVADTEGVATITEKVLRTTLCFWEKPKEV